MNASRLVILLAALFLGRALDVPAQQSEAERKQFEELKVEAEKGDAEAQSNLGKCYFDGAGVAQDHAEAVKWFRKAADQGVADAQYNLGNYCNEGKGVPQDDAEAVNWYRKAAEQGYAKAQFNLGLSFGKGEGVAKNYLEAFVWLSLAAAQDLRDASRNRDIVARRMSASEIQEGQRRVAAFKPKKSFPSASR